MRKTFLAYENESDTLNITESFRVENRLDRISLYGTLDITKDKLGLQYAYELKHIIDAAIEVLKQSDLPKKVQVNRVESVQNPFK